MKARARALIYAALLGALGAPAAASSCTTDTTAIAYTGPTGTPSVAIASPPPGACVEVSDNAAAFVPLALTLDNFIFRPPGACIGLTNCGQARVTVNGVDNGVTASDVVDVTFGSEIASPFGTWTIEVELIQDDGAPWIYPADAGTGGAPVSFDGPYTATVTFTTAASCSTQM